MTDGRYNRWQGYTISQLSVAIALISGLSVAGLGVGFTLLQNKEFLPTAPYNFMFSRSFVLLAMAAILSCGSVITRLLDFRLTARKIRRDQNPDYRRSLTIFWLGPEFYGRATWGFFWLSCMSFIVGITMLFISIAATFPIMKLI